MPETQRVGKAPGEAALQGLASVLGQWGTPRGWHAPRGTKSLQKQKEVLRRVGNLRVPLSIVPLSQWRDKNGGHPRFRSKGLWEEEPFTEFSTPLVLHLPHTSLHGGPERGLVGYFHFGSIIYKFCQCKRRGYIFPPKYRNISIFIITYGLKHVEECKSQEPGSANFHRVNTPVYQPPVRETEHNENLRRVTLC